MQTTNAITQLLEQCYTKILTNRMEGIPVVNPALDVSALEFRTWQEFYLGVMSTPWFMNLMLVPATEVSQQSMTSTRVGEKQIHLFPSGAYEFTQGYEAAVGHYQTCSLFSPMFDFPDQQTVAITATEIMTALMDEKHQENLTFYEEDIKRAWREPEIDTKETENIQSPEYQKPKKMSRRKLFVGALND